MTYSAKSIGSEFSISGYAVNVPLQVNVLGLVTLDFRGGSSDDSGPIGIKLRVEENISSGLGGVKLRVIAFEEFADSPVLGRVTMSLADTKATPLSLLEVIKDMPPTYQAKIFLDFTLTIEKPPGGGPPLVLSNTKTATLINNNLPQFPPQGNVFQLQAPVDLAPPNALDQVVAQLQQFPVTFTRNR